MNSQIASVATISMRRTNTAPLLHITDARHLKKAAPFSILFEYTLFYAPKT